MAARLSEATGLSIEQRAEGLALVDETGALTDVAMPAERTDAHVTLLVAGFLARSRETLVDDTGQIREYDIVDFLRNAKERYSRYWRKSAREPGAERELAAIAVDRLEKPHLITGCGSPTPNASSKPENACAKRGKAAAKSSTPRQAIAARSMSACFVSARNATMP